MMTTKIIVAVVLIAGLAACGTTEDGGKAGIGFGGDEIQPSPCACKVIKGPYRTPVMS